MIYLLGTPDNHVRIIKWILKKEIIEEYVNILNSWATLLRSIFSSVFNYFQYSLVHDWIVYDKIHTYEDWYFPNRKIFLPKFLPVETPFFAEKCVGYLWGPENVLCIYIVWISIGGISLASDKRGFITMWRYYFDDSFQGAKSLHKTSRSF